MWGEAGTVLVMQVSDAGMAPIDARFAKLVSGRARAGRATAFPPTTKVKVVAEGGGGGGRGGEGGIVCGMDVWRDLMAHAEKAQLWGKESPPCQRATGYPTARDLPGILLGDGGS